MPTPESRVDPVERLRPLAELGMGDEILSGLVESAPDGIVVTDEGGRILLVNRQTEQLFGYDRSDLLGRPVEELLPERFRQGHRAHRTRYRAEPLTRPMGSGDPLFGRRKNGSEFPVEISLSPLREDSRLLVVAAVRDVTERIEAEVEQRQIAELLDATRDGILIFDAETLRFTYVNDGAVEQVGYSRDELLNMTMLHLAPEFTEARLRELLEPLARGEVSSTMFTTVHRRHDGTDVPVEIMLQAGSTDQGRPHAFIKLTRDISDRMEVEERLRQAGADLRLLEDRERIARDLHDTVIQRIFAAGMSMQAVSTMVADHDSDAAERVDRIVDELDETIRDVRAAIYGLQAQTTVGDGLRHDILRVIEEERQALGTEPRLRFDGLIETVSDEVASHLLATLREALSNVARHAHARSIAVIVEAGDRIVLRVIDDGVGVPHAPTSGNGMHNMSERAHQLGGFLRITPQDGAGTMVEWSVPNR